jgi:threonine synthase
LLPRKDLWRYAPLLPLEPPEIRSRGEGGTPLHRLRNLGTGGRVARIKVEALDVKDEGLNPTGTFKARGMAVAVPMAGALGASTLVAPTAGNAGAALALYAATYGAQAIVLLAQGGAEEATREAIAFGAHVLRVPHDITEAGRIARELASTADIFSVATLREPYRVEGKKTMLFEIWEALGGLPDWIVIPTGGGTGVVGMWKALHELRDLGWYDGPWPRFAVVQAEGCAPLVKAWKEGRDSADPWPDPRTEAAGLRVPATIGDRLVLRAIRETRGAAVAVSDAAMQVASQNLATFEGIPACLEGAATHRVALLRGADGSKRGRGAVELGPHVASALTSSKTFLGSGGTFGSSVTHLYRTTPERSRTKTERFATPSRPTLPNRSYWTPYARLTVRFQSLKSG